MTYKALSLNETAQAFADLLPHGDCWAAANLPNSIFNLLLKSLSYEIVRLQNIYAVFALSYIPTLENLTRGDFKTRWQENYQIPDDCLRNNLGTPLSIVYTEAKIKSLFTLTTKASYIALAAFFNAILIVDYISTYQIHFTIAVDDLTVFPLTFPITFGSPTGALLECVYRLNIPAHIELTISIIDKTELGES